MVEYNLQVGIQFLKPKKSGTFNNIYVGVGCVEDILFCTAMQ